MLGIIEEKSKKGGIVIMGKLTCAITGYRPSRFRFKYNENNKDCKRIKRRMEEQFSLLYQKGVHHFIVGGTLGVDMWAGEILLAMKEKSEFSEIKLTMALPFEGYDVDWDRVSRERKNQIQKQAEVLVIGKEPGTPSYTKRNHFTSPREKQSIRGHIFFHPLAAPYHHAIIDNISQNSRSKRSKRHTPIHKKQIGKHKNRNENTCCHFGNGMSNLSFKSFRIIND